MESTSRKAMSDSLHFEKWLPRQPNTQVKSISSVLHVFQVSHFAFPFPQKLKKERMRERERERESDRKWGRRRTKMANEPANKFS